MTPSGQIKNLGDLREANACRRNAFTLTELLLVIAVIVILAMLLFPSLRTMQDRTNSSKCLHQLQILASVSSQWSADNDGRLFPASVDAAGWPQIIQPYVGNTVIRCPVYDQKYHPGEYPAMGYGRSYFFNGSSGIAGVDQMNGQGRLSQISQPSKTIAFFDNDNHIGGDAFGGYVVDGGGRWYYYLYPAHNNGFNVAFFDGHAEWVKFNSSGQFSGNAAGDYPQFIWKPY